MTLPSRQIDTEILVIGGGSTGTGVAWDAALRGFRATLVEKRDLTHGTTGRYHGLLHSGGRYVVKDPISARECIRENRILRETHTHCIEETGGFFVVTPEDEGDYPEQFTAACEQLGLPYKEISVAEALRREPLLNPRVSRVFEVSDGTADSFLAAHVTAQAATDAGAQVFTYHEVIDILTEGEGDQRRAKGARVLDVARGEEIIIHADMIINSAGAWSAKIAAMAEIPITVIPGKGVMVAMNHRVVNTVLNRCKMPSDGDIIVPVHLVSVIGTTDTQVTDPEHLTIEPWEVQKMLDEGDKMVPNISQARVVRAWAGVRPLYQEEFTGVSRDATRALALLDHSERHGLKGMLTITGGKWTTFRLMAELTMDKACEQLGVVRPSNTATTSVPGVEHGHYWLGHRLLEVEQERLQGKLICECELVTRRMIENAIAQNPTLTLDDLRRDVRLGMGPCQGGFCTYRAVGIICEHAVRNSSASEAPDSPQSSTKWDVSNLQSPEHAEKHASPARTKRLTADPEPNLLLRDFLQERWKGITPILWGDQLRQERLDQLIYLSLMNADHLPDRDVTGPMTDFYHHAVTSHQVGSADEEATPEETG